MSTLTIKPVLNRLLLIPLTVLLALSIGCRVEQQRAGELPDVDVAVEPGQLPKYEIEGPDVTVSRLKTSAIAKK